MVCLQRSMKSRLAGPFCAQAFALSVVFDGDAVYLLLVTIRLQQWTAAYLGTMLATMGEADDVQRGLEQMECFRVPCRSIVVRWQKFILVRHFDPDKTLSGWPRSESMQSQQTWSTSRLKSLCIALISEIVCRTPNTALPLLYDECRPRRFTHVWPRQALVMIRQSRK